MRVSDGLAVVVGLWVVVAVRVEVGFWVVVDVRVEVGVALGTAVGG